jgi:3-methyladenine DNA glycosylase AlkD
VDWKSLFIASLEKKEVKGMVDALEMQVTTHAGTAPSKIKQQAIALIRRTARDDRYSIISELCHDSSPTAKEIGAILLTDVYPEHPLEAEAILYSLADHPNWEVREWVASACGGLVERYFASFFPKMKEWSEATTENHRRAVVLAIMYAGKSRNPEFIEPFLNTLEPLMSDPSKYVRDNLGPFAIGSALIRYYPEQVLDRLHLWIKDENEQVRWNLAMIFSASEGAKYAGEAGGILEWLKRDERPYVKRAVNKALKAIAKLDKKEGEG